MFPRWLAVVAMVALAILGCDTGVGDDSNNNGGAIDGGPAETGAAYGHMTVTYSSGNASEGYETDLLLFADSATDDAVRNSNEDLTGIELLHFDFSEANAGADLDTGQYTLVDYGSNRTPMTVTEVDIARDFEYINNRSGRGAAWMASNATELEWGEFFDPIEFENFELVSDGTVTVSKDGTTYTIEWSLTTTAGRTIEGSYQGDIDVTVDDQ